MTDQIFGERAFIGLDVDTRSVKSRFVVCVCVLIDVHFNSLLSIVLHALGREVIAELLDVRAHLSGFEVIPVNGDDERRLGFLDDDAVLRALLTADDAVVVSSIQENIPRPTDDDTLARFSPGIGE